MTIPVHNSQLRLKKFREYLSRNGAALLSPTNEWEVLRVNVRGQISVLYKNKRGNLTWDDALAEAYDCYINRKSWSGLDGDKTKRPGKGKTVLERTIIARDGPACWFCGLEIILTLEHLLEISKGGNNHPFNLVMACFPCNLSVENKSIAEKVLFREKQRTSIAETA